MEQLFDQKAEEVQGLPSCSNENKLKLYGLYKQATVGDNDTSKPSRLNVTASKKWNAWNQCKGKGKQEAMQEYIDLVDQLMKQ
ncbi:hypothetical protein GEMRC1_008674 [Eukaryota sp. GEM-RC1]